MRKWCLTVVLVLAAVSAAVPAVATAPAAGAAALNPRAQVGEQAAPRRPGAGPSWSLQKPVVPTLPNGALNAVACPGSKECLAVGDETAVDGDTLALSEEWNGTSWAVKTTPEPAKTGQSILSGVACTSISSCWAVGASAANAGGKQSTLTEQWNGSSWSIRASANPSGQSAELNSVTCTSSSACMAVGSSLDTAGFGFSLAERWTGASWSIAKTPNGHDITNRLAAVACRSASSCVAVGSVVNSAATVLTLAEVWSGKTWSLSNAVNPTGDNASFAGAACSSTSCFGVGAFGAFSPFGSALIESWSGKTWSQVKPPKGTDMFNAVECVSKTSCTAVGSGTSTEGGDVTFADTWNGSAWTVQSTPNPSAGSAPVFNGVACSSPSACIAVGSFTSPAGPTVTLGAQWKTTSWTLSATADVSGSTSTQLTSVSCAAASACIAVGAEDNLTLAEAWNGTAWSLQKAPTITGAVGNRLSGVACTKPTDCMAVGVENTSLTYKALAQHWNGSSWTTESVPNPSGATVSSFGGLACPTSTDCVAVGSYQNEVGVIVTLAESWNGSDWKVVATPNPAKSAETMLNSVSCTSSKACVAVGSALNAKTFNSEPLAESFNGTAWTILSPVLPKGSVIGGLYGISCQRSDCMAVGTSDNSSFQQLLLTEEWNGSTWKLEPAATPAGKIDSPQFSSVVCTSSTSCIATGGWEEASGAFSFETLAESWNGSKWGILTTPSPDPEGTDSLDGISCSAASACTAVGVGTLRAIAERYSG